MGPIASTWLHVETKLQILSLLEASQHQGVSVRRSCLILAIQQRRVVRWQHATRRGLPLTNLIPGPKEPLHRMLPEETAQIVETATSEQYADLSHRILAVTAGDLGLFQASFSTVYRVLSAHDLMHARRPGGAHNGNSKAPIRKALTGPNQRWCWDISYLGTFQKGEYLYLYLLLDEYSRKVIQWRIGWHQTASEARLLLEGALEAENILDLPETQRPEVINDRGRQMKAKPIQRLCEEHGMPQLFARPRTPNDNPYIESAFSTVKRAPEYPSLFLDDIQSIAYFQRYFTWYNTEHYHSGIGYVTPDQAHRGLMTEILEHRQLQKLSQRRRRWEANSREKSGTSTKPNKTTMAAPRVA